MVEHLVGERMRKVGSRGALDMITALVTWEIIECGAHLIIHPPPKDPASIDSAMGFIHYHGHRAHNRQDLYTPQPN